MPPYWSYAVEVLIQVKDAATAKPYTEAMTTLIVFEPSNSLLSRDAQVLRLDFDLVRIERCGGRVVRYNYREHADAFARHPAVLAHMGEHREFLPIILCGEQVVSWGRYPSAEQLAGWARVELTENGGCGGNGCSCGGNGAGK